MAGVEAAVVMEVEATAATGVEVMAGEAAEGGDAEEEESDPDPGRGADRARAPLG